MGAQRRRGGRGRGRLLRRVWRSVIATNLFWLTLYIGLVTGTVVGLAWLIAARNSRRLRPLVISEDGQYRPWDDCKEYCFDSCWEGDGQILDGENKPLWRYKSVGGNRFRCQVYGFLRLPPFVVQDLEGRDLLAFKRIKRFPFSAFAIAEGDRVVGTILQQSFLSTRYFLELESGLRCTFHMPFLTVWFHGLTETDGRILVRLRGHRVWLVQIDSSINGFHLVAAIAFLHRERLRHG